MKRKPKNAKAAEPKPVAPPDGYGDLVSNIAQVITSGRRQTAWWLNSIVSAVYWDIGRQIIVFEQGGKSRGEYGERVIRLLAKDLTSRFGRGFGRSNLYQLRAFYLAYPEKIQTVSGLLPAPGNALRKVQTLSGLLLPKAGEHTISPEENRRRLMALAQSFPLPWSHYVRLLTIDAEHARHFYETEAIRGGWSVRQLDRQISTQLYERTAHSRDKAAMLAKAAQPQPGDEISPEAEIKDSYILEFLDLKDEYSETDLEEALTMHLETFLRELGNDFTFVGRQRRLRVGHTWYRVDLLFFHRRLRALVVIDLKVGKFSHADAGQMNMYLNYAREHWTNPDENPPVGLILCAEKDTAVARYSLEGLSNKVLAAEYKLALPNETVLAAELERTRRLLDTRHRSRPD